jgi:hypothetical protein
VGAVAGYVLHGAARKECHPNRRNLCSQKQSRLWVVLCAADLYTNLGHRNAPFPPYSCTMSLK